MADHKPTSSCSPPASVIRSRDGSWRERSEGSGKLTLAAAPSLLDAWKVLLVGCSVIFAASPACLLAQEHEYVYERLLLAEVQDSGIKSDIERQATRDLGLLTDVNASQVRSLDDGMLESIRGRYLAKGGSNPGGGLVDTVILWDERPGRTSDGGGGHKGTQHASGLGNRQGTKVTVMGGR